MTQPARRTAKDPVRLELQPLDKTLTVERGTSLRDALFAQGVEFPCGGRGRCKGCRIKILAGSLPSTEDDKRLLTAAELNDGWRLACRANAQEDLRIELAQWDTVILADESVFAFKEREGLGVAVDLGTTTVVAQLLDLRTGHVLAVRMALNAQATHGADIMSRVEFGLRNEGLVILRDLIRVQIGQLIRELTAVANVASSSLQDVVLVGNTVMHHLFCGLSIQPLSRHPFETDQDGLRVFPADALNWNLPGNPRVHFLPGLGSFVGSDILAGILATQLHQSADLKVLVDLGTNGEIVVGNRERMLCASTAAGPAFEGARLSMGMRAATGAISEVTLRDGCPSCRVLGDTAPRGICGSGLVDAVAVGLSLGRIQPSGRLADHNPFPLAGGVVLSQGDIRELQLAKGAIAAGLRILLRQWGAPVEEVSRVYLAGAFGNYINRTSARRIGLMNFPPEKISSAGNTALLGAKLALFNLQEQEHSFIQLRRKIRHVPLSEDEQFQDAFAEEMRFPE